MLDSAHQKLWKAIVYAYVYTHTSLYEQTSIHQYVRVINALACPIKKDMEMSINFHLVTNRLCGNFICALEAPLPLSVSRTLAESSCLDRWTHNPIDLMAIIWDTTNANTRTLLYLAVQTV